MPSSIKSSVALAFVLAFACHSPPRAEVTSFELNCDDLDAEMAFLRQLDFSFVAQRELRHPSFGQLLGLPGARAEQAIFMLGEQRVELRHFGQRVSGSDQTARANDLGFEHMAIVVSDLDAAHARVLENGARLVSTSPQTLPATNPVAGGIRAEYFRDPNGHFMELLQFPPDKGGSEWHRAGKHLFLGIDHTAIAVRRSSDSLRFYRDSLGLSLKSESLNQGREQESLSAVPGARVRITSLRGERGPGVELLEYLSPAGAQPFPSGNAADGVHWEIAIRVARLSDTLRALRAAGFPAPEHAVASSAVFSEERQAALVRDPDGHTVRLFEGAP